MLSREVERGTQRTPRGRYRTRGILTIAFIALTAIPILAAALFYYQTERKSLMDNTVQYERQLIYGVASDVRNLYAQFDKIQYEVSNQCFALKIPDIDYHAYTSQDLDSIRLLENLLQSMRRTIPGISNIYVVGFGAPRTAYSSSYSFSRERLLLKPWLQQPYTSSVEWRMLPNQWADYDNPSSGIDAHSRQKQVFCFATGLMDINMDEKFEYVIQIDMMRTYIVQLFERLLLDQSDALVLEDAQGSVILESNYENNPNRVAFDEGIRAIRAQGQDTLVNERNIITTASLSDAGLTIYKIREVDISANERSLILQIAMVALIALLFASVMATMLASSITRPFRVIINDTMALLSTNTKLKPVALRSANEDVQSIVRSFNVMIERVNELIQNVVQQEIDKKNVEIKMLQAQISPHFLYNTLNSIKWMALMHNQHEIADAVVSLVTLLEFCLKDTDSMVTVEQEVDFLHKYISLQQMRYGKSASVNFEIDPQAEGLYMPKFTLQPSVENALLHAFVTSDSVDPRVEVSGRLEQEMLVLRVSDNGVGYDVKAAKQLTGIGIPNVGERIRLTFGPEYGQAIESTIGKGTCVTITLPVIRTREETERRHV